MRSGAALLAGVGLALGGLGAAPAARAAPTAPAVVVVGVPGLRWDQVDAARTPNLWSLAYHGAVGSLSVRAAQSLTCPSDGWATLGAGNRARGPEPPDAECPPPPSTRPTADELQAARRDNDRLDFDARLGALGTLAAGAGRCVTAVGPVTGYAAPRPARYLPDVATLTAADLARCPLTVVEAAGDADVGRVDRLRPPGSVLLVVGLSDPGRPRLHVAIATGPGFGPGELVSASTRRTPYVQLVDVAPTALELLGVPRPDEVIGQPWRNHGSRAGDLRAEVDRLVDLDRQAVATARLVPPFFSVLVVGQVLLYLLAAATLRTLRRRRDRRRVRQVTRVVALSAAGVLAATFLANLVPWWRAAHPLPTLLAAVAVADLLLVGIALLGPWRGDLLGPAGALAALTALVLAGDLVTGAELQMSSLSGYSPMVAGRFAGIGNVAFGLLATGALLAAAVLAHQRSRRTAALVVTGVGVLAVVVDGAPPFGSDFGGVLALVPAFAVLGMLVTGVRLSALRLAAAAATGVLAVTAFALLDYARPPSSQTHVGRFVGQLLHDGAATIVRRKAEANLHLLTHSVLTLLVPLGVLFVAGVLLRPTGGLRRAFERAPAFRAGLLAVLVMGVVGFAVNDSGVAVPALAMTLAIPLAIAVSVTAVLHDPRGAAPES